MTTGAVGTNRDTAGEVRGRSVSAPAWVAFGAVALLLTTAGRYGWHRDELYFFEAGRHLSWGFVDFPPAVAGLAAVSRALFGNSLIGFRLWSALAVGIVILVTAMMTARLGGGRRSRFIAAFTAGLSPLIVGAGHLVSTTTFELLAWAVMTWLVVRLLAGDDERLWLAVGLVAGAGFLVKHSMVFLVLALALALVITRRTAPFRSRYVWAGATLGVLIALPNVVWHATNDWPVFEMLESLQDESQGIDALAFLPAQVAITGLTAVVWIPGLLWLMRSKRSEPWRALGVTYLLLAAFFTVTAGKPYYLIGMYPVLFAAGSIWWTERERQWIPVTAVAVGSIGLVFALPVLPVEQAADLPIEDLELEFGAQLGWEELVDDAAAAHRSLGPAAAIVTSNYGTAGAIDLHGSGLPSAHSPHNHYWFWGPPPDDTNSAVVVGFSEEVVSQWFDECVLSARFRAPHGVAAEEEGSPVWMCTGQRISWVDIWPELKAFRA